eukprot:CAMPEP_0196809736 /NCGR_PEP_ID=MMETSP1362-20130617/9625_1 /TAXON_ID=163516 /ORGANISM="Leptocylindrus danicus, Strain CCMP1856" /LENGTH=83 /DNA_ID=CAMNT_0042184503 /DNA_START=40 /DNA_END=289 /DNA_ORIENTATION=-
MMRSLCGTNNVAAAAMAARPRNSCASAEIFTGNESKNALRSGANDARKLAMLLYNALLAHVIQPPDRTRAACRGMQLNTSRSI